ncbi:MAG: acyl-CoA thioester hydrolase/BAAT C-terminal domain-containing protein, partial [Pseudomonadota bacterium]
MPHRCNRHCFKLWLPAAQCSSRASYGAMAALVTASYLPADIGAVVAIVPSHIILDVVDAGGDLTPQPVFTLRGAPLAYVDGVTSVAAIFSGQVTRHESAKRASFRFRHSDAQRPIWNSVAKTDPAHIPVERMQAPLFIAAGGDDAAWPSMLAGEHLA